MHGRVWTFAAPPLHNPFHCADNSQFVMQQNGLKPSTSGGIVSTVPRLSRSENDVANSANVSFVSRPIMIFKGIQRFLDCAFIVVGLSRSGCSVRAPCATVCDFNSASNDGQIFL